MEGPFDKFNPLPESPPPFVEEDDTGQLPEIYGFPSWIKLAGLAVALLTLYSLARAPEAIRWSVQAERGLRDLHQGHYEQAAKELGPVLAKYPASINLNLDLAEAQFRAGRLDEAFDTMDHLVGREVDEQEAARADSIDAQIHEAMEREVASFGHSLDVAEYQLRTKQIHEAKATMNSLRGKRANEEQHKRADHIADQITAALDQRKENPPESKKAGKN